MKRVNRFGGRSQSLVMKCPEVSVGDREHIQCDPEYIQVNIVQKTQLNAMIYYLFSFVTCALR